MRPERDKIYRASEGNTERLMLPNPITDKTCRVIFLGNEWPGTHPPNHKPTNLEIAMNLSLVQTEEVVTLYSGFEKSQ